MAVWKGKVEMDIVQLNRDNNSTCHFLVVYELDANAGDCNVHVETRLEIGRL